MRVAWLDDEGEPLAKVIVAHRLDEGTIGHARATETIDFFRLNKDPGLEYERKRRLEEAETCYRKYTQDVDAADNVAALRRMASRYQPFGIVVRNFVEDMEPALLPTSAEELRWFLEELGERLEIALRQCALESDVPDHAKRSVEEVVFALATLWRDPPSGDAGRAAVEQWLVENGLKERVAAAYAMLEAPLPESRRAAPARPSSVPPAPP